MQTGSLYHNALSLDTDRIVYYNILFEFANIFYLFFILNLSYTLELFDRFSVIYKYNFNSNYG